MVVAGFLVTSSISTDYHARNSLNLFVLQACGTRTKVSWGTSFSATGLEGGKSEQKKNVAKTHCIVFFESFV